MHGGIGSGRPSTELQLKRLVEKKDLAKRVEEIRSDPRLLDGREHLALVLALMESLVSDTSDKDMVDADMLRLISTTVTSAQKTIESIHKIDQGYWLSPERVQEEIQRAGQIIQSSCKGCPSLPKIAEQFHALKSTDNT